MNHISPNNPAYYLTSVTRNRLPVFRLDKLKSIACAALHEARGSGEFLILAYVIMSDHLHVISDGEKKAAVVLRFINGLISRRVIDFLKSEGHQTSLEKLRRESDRRGHNYSLWDHHQNVRQLTSEHVHAAGSLHSSEPGEVGTGREGRPLSVFKHSAMEWMFARG